MFVMLLKNVIQGIKFTKSGSGLERHSPYRGVQTNDDADVINSRFVQVVWAIGCIRGPQSVAA